MSLESLTTEMRELSSTYNDHMLISVFIDNEVVKLRNKESDVITHLCMPGIRKMNEVIINWYDHLTSTLPTIQISGATYFKTTNGADTDYAYLLIKPSDANYDPQSSYELFGNPNIAYSTIDEWSIQKRNIYEESGSDWNIISTPTNSRDYEYTDITNETLSDIGFDTNTFNLTTLSTYVSQFDFGMEWLHARATEYTGSGSSTYGQSNPYAGSLRGFGIKEQIEQQLNGRNAQDTNTAFYLNAYNRHDGLLS